VHFSILYPDGALFVFYILVSYTTLTDSSPVCTGKLESFRVENGAMAYIKVPSGSMCAPLSLSPSLSLISHV
jgi:hypothetical protein